MLLTLPLDNILNILSYLSLDAVTDSILPISYYFWDNREIFYKEIYFNAVYCCFHTIDLTYNTGIAFGLLSDYTIFTYILSIFVFIWLVFQIRDIREQNLEKLSLVLILSGAVGNLGERGWNLITDNDGKVTDFVELLFIPSFNLADTYISIGIVLLLYSEIKKD